jgi:FkbH-like protein
MNKSYLDIQETLNRVDFSGYPKLNISVLHNITVETISIYLKYFAYELGYHGVVSFGDYDTIFQDAVIGNPAILNSSTDCVVIFSNLEVLSPLLTRGFANLKPEEILTEVNRLIDYVSSISRGLRQQTSAAIVWMGFELPFYPSLGILDSQSSRGQYRTIQGLNFAVQDSLGELNNAFFMDLNQSVARLSVEKYFDARYWHLAKAPFTRDALQDISRELFKFIRALKGRNKKCLVLDCDNTLWGGVIGEDGLAGIKLSSSGAPGSSFYEFQQEILNLYHRGILIALCSKNDEGAVWDVFRNHPDMVLSESHIVASRINWNDKASNIKEIAATLNIGIDSIVFLDDSEFEVNLVNQLLPEVVSVVLPIKKPTEYRRILAGGGWFDGIALTSEDKTRGEMYQAERQRNVAKSQYEAIKEYYKSLEMVAEFSFTDSFSIPRVAQLTQKTNQFNLTTRRYSESDISGYVIDQESDVVYLKLKDKFGDYGIVGVGILRYEDEVATIDSLLMSCRVLGRKVEDALLVALAQLVSSRGYEEIVGYYNHTEKNSQVETFYVDRCFTPWKENSFKGTCSDIISALGSSFIGEVKLNLSL